MVRGFYCGLGMEPRMGLLSARLVWVGVSVGAERQMAPVGFLTRLPRCGAKRGGPC